MHLLEEYSVGTNAPPMHPRCRSTISAIVEGGKRIARDKSGKNIQVPAEMKYPDYKKIYLEQSMTLEQWEKNRPAKSKDDELKRGEDIIRRLANGEKVTPTRLINNENNGKISIVNVKLTSQQQKIKESEDKAFAAATGKDFGFKKLNREPNWATEISYVNGNGKSFERMINCQRCVVALEARMLGYDVIARPSYGITDEMRKVENLLNVFEKTNPILKLSKEELEGDIVESVENIVKSFGKGSRAFIWFKWDKNTSHKNGSHIIGAQCQEKNVVQISDGQTKLIAARQQLKEAVAESICIMRVDNLKFTDLVKRFCMNRSSSDDNT